MKFKCIMGLHEWEKLRGLENLHNGKFMQRYVCKKCRKIKEVVKWIREKHIYTAYNISRVFFTLIGCPPTQKEKWTFFLPMGVSILKGGKNEKC